MVNFIILLSILAICILVSFIVGKQQTGFLAKPIFFIFAAPIFTALILLIAYPILFGFDKWMVFMFLPLLIPVLFLMNEKLQEMNYTSVYKKHHPSIKQTVLNLLPTKEDVHVGAVFNSIDFSDKMLSKSPEKLKITIYVRPLTEKAKEVLSPDKKEIQKKINDELSQTFKSVLTHIEFHYVSR